MLIVDEVFLHQVGTWSKANFKEYGRFWTPFTGIKGFIIETISSALMVIQQFAFKFISPTDHYSRPEAIQEFTFKLCLVELYSWTIEGMEDLIKCELPIRKCKFDGITRNCKVEDILRIKLTIRLMSLTYLSKYTSYDNELPPYNWNWVFIPLMYELEHHLDGWVSDMQPIGLKFLLVGFHQ